MSHVTSHGHKMYITKTFPLSLKKSPHFKNSQEFLVHPIQYNPTCSHTKTVTLWPFLLLTRHHLCQSAEGGSLYSTIFPSLYPTT